MEEKLVLGLPDVAASIAPKNRFEVHDKPELRYWRVMNPALILAAVGAFLGKLHSETQADKLQERSNTADERPLPEDGRDAAYYPSGVDVVQQVAEYLRQVAKEAGSAGRDMQFSGNPRGIHSSFHARVGLNPDDDRFTPSFRMRQSANDNQEVDGLFKMLAPLGSTTGSAGERKQIAGSGGEDTGQKSGKDGLDGDISSADTGAAVQPERNSAGSSNGSAGNGPGSGPEPGPESSGRFNRLPVIAGRVLLGSGLMNLSALILLDNLVSAATDADGDTLSIRNLAVSSGDIRSYGNASWLYTPERGYTGEVAFTYGINDGTGSVSATALFDLVKGPPRQISGTEYDDVLLGTPEEDILSALGGDDILYGRESDDVINGGDGDDTLMGGNGNDVLYGEAGHDRMFGGAGDDILFGGDGDDAIYGEEGDDVLIAGAGDDVAGGGFGNDHIFGEVGNDQLSGEAGDDLLDGGDGDDIMSGGSGNDAVIGGAGNDIVITGPGIEEVRAAAGPAPAATVSDGHDSYSGGDGFDTYDAFAASCDLIINLVAKLASGVEIGTDSVDGFEAAIGGGGNDTIVGEDGDNLLVGNAGDDSLTGGNGDDRVLGGTGDDTVVVLYASNGSSDGDDSYSGGEGVDTYNASATVSAVVIDLDAGAATGVEIGSDQIEGFEAAIAGLGDDVLVANAQINFLTGGGGNDVFIFRSVEAVYNNGAGTDKILDFRIGDRIDLSDLAGEIGGLMFDRIMDEINDQQDVRRIRLYSEFDGGENTIMRAVIDLADERDDLELLIYGHQAPTEDDFILAVREEDAGMARA